MAKNKLKLAFITENSARKSSFKKRKKSMMKKMDELTTLCGVEGCAILYSPYSDQPEVWPNEDGVQQMVAQFQSMSVTDQSKKMVDQGEHLRKRIDKANEQLKKQMKVTREKKMMQVMYQCLAAKEPRALANLNMADLSYLESLVDKTLTEIDSRIETLKKMPTAPPPPPQLQAVVGDGSTTSHMMAGGVAVNWYAPPPQPQLPQPQTVVVGDGSTTSHMMVGGVAVNGYAPVGDNLGAMDGMQSTDWLADWINNLGEHDSGLRQGDDTTMPSPNDPSPMWSSAFFPKTI